MSLHGYQRASTRDLRSLQGPLGTGTALQRYYNVAGAQSIDSHVPSDIRTIPLAMMISSLAEIHGGPLSELRRAASRMVSWESTPPAGMHRF